MAPGDIIYCLLLPSSALALAGLSLALILHFPSPPHPTPPSTLLWLDIGVAGLSGLASLAGLARQAGPELGTSQPKLVYCMFILLLCIDNLHTPDPICLKL